MQPDACQWFDKLTMSGFDKACPEPFGKHKVGFAERLTTNGPMPFERVRSFG